MSPLFDDFPDLPTDDGPSITLYRDGPLILRGACRIVAADGREIDPGRATVALCRCGRSALKPFCDGSHAVTGFHASGGDERAAATSGPRPTVRDAQPLSPVADTREESPPPIS